MNRPRVKITYVKVASSDQMRKQARIQVYTGKKYLLSDENFVELVCR